MPDSLFSSASIDGSSVLLVSSAWVDGPSSSLLIIPSSRLKPSDLSIAILLSNVRDDSSCAGGIPGLLTLLLMYAVLDERSCADNARPKVLFTLLLMFAVLDERTCADDDMPNLSALLVSLFMYIVLGDRSCADDDDVLNLSDSSIALLLYAMRDDNSCADDVTMSPVMEARDDCLD